MMGRERFEIVYDLIGPTGFLLFPLFFLFAGGILFHLAAGQNDISTVVIVGTLPILVILSFSTALHLSIRSLKKIVARAQRREREVQDAGGGGLTALDRSVLYLKKRFFKAVIALFGILILSFLVYLFVIFGFLEPGFLEGLIAMIFPVLILIWVGVLMGVVHRAYDEMEIDDDTI